MTATASTAPKATAPKATAPKPSPVRKDVAPADVTPEAHTPEQAQQIKTLEGLAARYLHDGRSAAERLANTLVKLFPLQPWAGQKLANGHPMTVGGYYSALGNRLVGTDVDARRIVVKALDGLTDIDTLVAVAGSSKRTIIRDRRDMGLARAENVTPPAPPTPEEPEETDEHGPVTRMVPVLSMTSVRQFINDLTDRDMVQELLELCQDRDDALSAK